jgi:succinate dehydrogenase / fumarate reductase iron-sulfur subunit
MMRLELNIFGSPGISAGDAPSHGGRWHHVFLETGDSRTLLDVLESAKINAADGKPQEDMHIAYRHSCHHGSCGTCGALVDGKPRLLCLTKLSELGPGSHTIEPLASTTWIADIAVEPRQFFLKHPETDYLIRNADGQRLEDCIECGLCLSACPVEKPFAGPAALAALDIEMAKHEERREGLVLEAGKPDGAKACERSFECSKVCPRGVAPGRRITNLLKRLG